MKIQYIVCTMALLVICCCTCKKSNQEILKYGILTGADYQHRNAVALTGLRYVGLAELFQTNQVEKIKEELDWFIDMMIMEIAYSEKNIEPTPDYVKEELIHIIENVNLGKPVTPPEFGLKRLAKYRKNNPRIHKNELSKESISLIDEFVNKYTGHEVKTIIDKYLESVSD